MDERFYKSWRSAPLANKPDFCVLCDDPVTGTYKTAAEKESLIECFDRDTYDAAVANVANVPLPEGHCLPPKRGMQSNCPWDKMLDPSLTDSADTGKAYITRSCVIGPAGQQSTLPEDLNYQCARVAINGDPLTTRCSTDPDDLETFNNDDDPSNDDPYCYALKRQGMTVGDENENDAFKYLGSGYHIPIEKLLLTVQGYQSENMESDPVTGEIKFVGTIGTVVSQDGDTVSQPESSLSRQLCGYEKCPSNFTFSIIEFNKVAMATIASYVYLYLFILRLI